MKTITLKQELDIMYGTRGYHTPKPYAVCGSHYSSLKLAIKAAKNVDRAIVHIMTTKEHARFKTIATVTKREGYYEIVIW